MRRASKKRMEQDVASRSLKNYKMCLRKVLFWTEISARAAADKITRKGHPMRAYSCPNCGNWHIASDKEVLMKKKQDLAS